jgi:hypothetical protein
MYAPPIVAQASPTQITQQTVMALVIVAALFVVGLLVLLGIFVWRTEEPLKYGNFFVVALGLTTALMGFLVAFPLIISGVFSDPTQVLAILSALFGTIVGLVGTYFGIKASSDATKGAQDQANKATIQAVQAASQGAPGGEGGPPAEGPPGGGPPPEGPSGGGSPAEEPSSKRRLWGRNQGQGPS